MRLLLAVAGLAIGGLLMMRALGRFVRALGPILVFAVVVVVPVMWFWNIVPAFVPMGSWPHINRFSATVLPIVWTVIFGLGAICVWQGIVAVARRPHREIPRMRRATWRWMRGE